MAKETVYIDVDEDITAIIGKITNAKESVVAIVLPKRATVFQSTVNMKLAKKAAKEVKKNIVLITSEPALTAVAAAAGVHIATSLSSKPAIPKPKKQQDETAIDSSDIEEVTSASVATAALSGTGAAAAITSEGTDSTVDSIEIDNTDSAVETSEATSVSDKKVKKNKFKIPDFSSFKVRMVLGISLLVVLITGWVFGFVILPKATITVEADTKRVDYSVDYTIDTELEEADIENNVIPGELVEITKEDRATVDATGEKNNGERATGTLTLTNCRQGAAGVTIPEGAGFAANGKTYSTNETIELGPAVYVGDDCISADLPSFGAVKDVGVTANEPGEDYNIASQSFESPTSGVTAFGSDMAGGTTDIVTVVSRDDISKAEEQLSGIATADATTELRGQLEESNLFAIPETLQESDAKITNSSSVDEEADEVTIVRTVTFSMIGVQQEHLTELANNKIRESLAEESQNIRDSGVESAVFQLLTADTESNQTLRMQSVATIGQTFDAKAIASEMAGKKRGDIEATLEAKEGIRDVSVSYSPLWVTTTPKNADKISVIINETE
jgi:hypothetical protein